MRTARALLAVASFVALAHAGAAGVRAADETLGATIQSRVYLDQGGDLIVWNRSTVEARFDLSSSDGWIVTPASVVLAPNESATVVVSGAGADGSTIDITLRGTAPVPKGQTESVLAFASRVFYEAPLDWLPIIAWIVASIVAIIALSLALRRLRPWEYRVQRRV